LFAPDVLEWSSPFSHLAETPPSTDNIGPVTHSASEEVRNSTQFLTFNASVEFRVVMTPDDLQKAGLDEVGRKWA
jgi:hypothetical protein